MRFRQTPAALSENRPLRAGPYIWRVPVSFLVNPFTLSAELPILAAPAISPALIEQAKRMSPAQREALARQYGISLGGVAASGNAVFEEQVLQEALQRPP